MGKICPNCGKELSENAKFCSKCGNRYEEQTDITQQNCKFCSNCGNQVRADAKFCHVCGYQLLQDIDKNNQPEKQKQTVVGHMKKGVGGFVNTINDMTGQQGQADIHLKELFSEVFKKHSVEERDELFICGTKKNDA